MNNDDSPLFYIEDSSRPKFWIDVLESVRGVGRFGVKGVEFLTLLLLWITYLNITLAIL